MILAYTHFVCAKLLAIRNILSVCFGGLNTHHYTCLDVSLLQLEPHPHTAPLLSNAEGVALSLKH